MEFILEQKRLHLRKNQSDVQRSKVQMTHIVLPYTREKTLDTGQVYTGVCMFSPERWLVLGVGSYPVCR